MVFVCGEFLLKSVERLTDGWCVHTLEINFLVDHRIVLSTNTEYSGWVLLLINNMLKTKQQ